MTISELKERIEIMKGVLVTLVQEDVLTNSEAELIAPILVEAIFQNEYIDWSE